MEKRVSYEGQPVGTTSEAVSRAMATDITKAQAKDLAHARTIVADAIEGNDIADDHLPEALQFMKRSAARMAEQREQLQKMNAEFKRSNEPAKGSAPAYIASTGDSKAGIASRFSFTRAICNVLEGRQQDGAEAEMIREGRSQFSSARGQIVVPDWGARELRNVYGSDATSGSIDAAVKGLQTMAGAPLRGALHGQPLVEQLGATVINATGSNTVLLPWLGVVDAASTAEGASVGSPGNTSDFQEVSLSPTRYSRKVTVSQLSLRTTGNGGNMDTVLLNDMSNALATAQDKQAFAAIVSAAQFALATENGTNGLEATDMDDIHNLVSKYMDVTGRNEYPDLIVSKLGAKAVNTGLSGTDTTISERYIQQTGARIIPAVNLVDGDFVAADAIDGAASGTIAGAGISIAGDMASLALARWGGFDLLVDVYGANADGHLVSLHANAYSAAGVLNNAFAKLAVAPSAIAAT